MKKIICLVISFLLLTGIYSNVNAGYEDSVNKIMNNYYINLDNKSSTIQLKIIKLKKLQSQIIKIIEIKGDKLSVKNKDILNIIDKSITTRLNFYIEKKQYNTKHEYQLKSVKNGDKVAFIDTNKGMIKIKLFSDDLPRTTLNFIGLSQNGNYSGLIFHRVINNFMIQGGDPTGTGVGLNSIYGGNFNDEFTDKLSNIKGSIAMANYGENTNSSQFFINQVDNTFLDYNKSPYTSKNSVFGQVIEGMGVINNIAKVEVNPTTNKPKNDIIINTVTIREYNNGKYDNYKIDIEKEVEKLEEIERKDKELKIIENKSRKAQKGDKVSLHYTLTLEDGEIIDSSYNNFKPFEFTVGQEGIITGFSEAIIGMKVDETKNTNISPSKGYGEYDENNTQTVNKSSLQSFVDQGIELKTGEILPTSNGDFKIISTTQTDVIIDTNHSLAGKNLIFKIELIDFID